MFDFFGKGSADRFAKRQSPPLRLTQIKGAAVKDSYGLPRVDWKAVHLVVHALADTARDELWTDLASQWLALFQSALGARYRIFESDHLLQLSSQNERAARRFLKFGEDAYRRLEHFAARTAKERGLGKHAILIFEPSKIYYDYISYFYSERDHAYGTSSGVHISTGYRHTVLNGPLHLRALVHELAHDMVNNRPLPLWVNEGFAQAAEAMVSDTTTMMTHRQKCLHFRYWSWFGIDRFWSGESFREIGGQRLSYELSAVLFQNLSNGRRTAPRIREFLATAHRDDAGDAACQACFGRPLSSIVEEFLGAGPWAIR